MKKTEDQSVLHHSCSLHDYLLLGGTLENLQKHGTIYDEYQQSPFLRDQVGNIKTIEPNGTNNENRNLYRVTYENGKVRETFGECWISVRVKMILHPDYLKL